MLDTDDRKATNCIYLFKLYKTGRPTLKVCAWALGNPYPQPEEYSCIVQ